MMIGNELIAPNEVPARVVHKALDECSTISVENERERNQEDPSRYYALPHIVLQFRRTAEPPNFSISGRARRLQGQ